MCYAYQLLKEFIILGDNYSNIYDETVHCLNEGKICCIANGIMKAQTSSPIPKILNSSDSCKKSNWQLVLKLEKIDCRKTVGSRHVKYLLYHNNPIIHTKSN